MKRNYNFYFIMYLTRYGWNLGNLLESFLVLPYLCDSVKGRLKNSHTGKSFSSGNRRERTPVTYVLPRAKGLKWIAEERSYEYQTALGPINKMKIEIASHILFVYFQTTYVCIC